MINIKKIIKFLITVGTLISTVFSTAVQADTLDDIKERGFLRCGASVSKSGFSSPSSSGWKGIEIDFCKAISAAIFGDASKNEIVPVTSKVRFTALTGGSIDVLVKGTTWTYSRDAKLGVDWGGYFFFDGQGFLVSKDLGITSAKQLSGATICVSPGTTSEKNVADYFRINNMTYKPVIINVTEILTAIQQNRCDVVTNDISALAAQRLKFSNPDNFVILPDNIAKEPLSIYTRQNESRWNDIVIWTRNVLVEAEELDLTQENVRKIAVNTKDPRISRLLGKTGGYGTMLGLSNDWALNIIESVGNYGEIYDRNVGKNSKVNISRGLNKLWSDGGLMFSPPFR